MSIQHPMVLIILDIFFVAFIGGTWFVSIRRFSARKTWRRVHGVLKEYVIMGYVLRPYAWCRFSFMDGGKEVIGTDMVFTSSIKKLKKADFIELAVNEKRPEKSLICVPAPVMSTFYFLVGLFFTGLFVLGMVFQIRSI